LPELLVRLRSALSDSYTIESEVGQGGMATVFLAQDVKHDRQVAIKVLHPEVAASVGHERFLREIQIAARLEHPNILTLIDSGEAGGLTYFVMPYLEGGSLRDRLDKEGELPIEEALQIAAEVADGLDYAHEKGVVHRDIKPSNILLYRGHALVADFGIARALDLLRGEALDVAATEN
jgi:serine/threonine protein kinase